MSNKPAAIQIRSVHDEKELRDVWPVVQQLRPELDEARFVAQATRQMREGYRATVLYDAGIVRGYAGWRVMEFLVYGRHVYIDDLVTDATARSLGYGKALLDAVKQEALDLECVRLQLDSGTHRKDAHAFYLREGLRIEAFHFGIDLKKLKP